MTMAIGVVSAEELLYGHAISFTRQANLRQMLEETQSGARRLVLLVGAGVAMDAGLPSWSSLIDSLLDSLPGDESTLIRALECPDKQRQAQAALHFAKKTSAPTDREPIRRICKALYGGASSSSPGMIAQAIARLVAVYPNTVRLVTTNFDGVLESALAQVSESSVVTSWSMAREAEWNALPDQEAKWAVLHLHGLIKPDETVEGPVILTENDFHAHGRDVQDFLVKLMSDAVVICVGLSLTDPNVVGPLSKHAGPKRDRYVLAVPQLSHDTISTEECARFAVKQAEMLEEHLHIRPVLLKSYAQVGQVLSELALASKEVSKYSLRRGKPTDSLLYGSRYSTALAECYAAMGANKKTGALPSQQTMSLSFELHEQVRKRGGPDSVARRLRKVYRAVVDPNEKLAYYLWLRVPHDRSDRLVHSRRSDFAVRLVASSIYAHWDAWAAERIETISPAASFAAAKCVYYGQGISRNIDGSSTRNVWKGVIAYPLVAYGVRSDAKIAGEPLDRLLLGAISINTTCPVVHDPAMPAADRPSFLAVVSDEEIQEFKDSVFKAAERLLV